MEQLIIVPKIGTGGPTQSVTTSRSIARPIESRPTDDEIKVAPIRYQPRPSSLGLQVIGRTELRVHLRSWSWSWVPNTLIQTWRYRRSRRNDRSIQTRRRRRRAATITGTYLPLSPSGLVLVGSSIRSGPMDDCVGWCSSTSRTEKNNQPQTSEFRLTRWGGLCGREQVRTIWLLTARAGGGL